LVADILVDDIGTWCELRYELHDFEKRLVGEIEEERLSGWCAERRNLARDGISLRGRETL
jgi:hypothetical protein